MPVRSIQLKEIINIGKKKIIPSSVLVEVCYRCNENCLHCCLDNHKQKGLTLTQYGQLFDQMVEAGTFYVILTGGEPFIRSDFMEIVKAARKRRLSVTIFTNGTLITDEQIETLRLLWVDEVHVSIYSADANVHDSITRLCGSFTRSIITIEKMLKIGLSVRIKCPLMNITVDGIEAIKKLARNLGVNVQYSTIITSQNDGKKDTTRYRLTSTQLLRVLTDPEVVILGTEPIYFRENMKCIPCDTVFNGGSIDPEGNVYVCNQWRVCGGNILDRPLGEIWRQSSVFRKLRDIRLCDLKECSFCDLFQHCTRCPGLAYLEDGDMLGCSSAAKIVAEARKKVGVFPTESHIFSPSIG